MLNSKVAEEVARRFAESSRSCEASLRVVMTTQNLGVTTVYGKLVGTFMGFCFTNILGPIWKTYPALEPLEMKTPYVESVATLSPESRAALEAFLSLAHASIEFASQQVSAEEQASMFGFGGISEVNETVQAIADFLAHPRHRDGPTTVV